MAKRIAWSQHEVALLFRAYEEFAAGAGLNQVAEDLSKTLRTMALRAGQFISDFKCGYSVCVWVGRER